MIVAAQGNGAAMGRRALIGGVLEHVARAVHAWPLAVPQAEHAIVFWVGQHAHLLATPDGGRGKVLVDAWLEMDVVFVQMLAGTPQRQVVAAQRRAAIAGDEGGGLQPRRTVPARLQDGQTHQRLDARQIHTPIEAGVFVVQRHRGAGGGLAARGLIEGGFLAGNR